MTLRRLSYRRMRRRLGCHWPRRSFVMGHRSACRPHNANTAVSYVVEAESANSKPLAGRSHTTRTPHIPDLSRRVYYNVYKVYQHQRRGLLNQPPYNSPNAETSCLF
ncbi:hypothetical protein RRG08_003550 [Elysia crispata]|uniref:Uncharacterized protein n=1 Tax=Elysia crispata TaxID=231223 RepID=A0AAE0Y6H1_9GAST|nr:hypothetical protein RRG08_003550 [Elysia crispata]